MLKEGVADSYNSIGQKILSKIENTTILVNDFGVHLKDFMDKIPASVKCNKKYIITLHTSAGKYFADPELANAKPNACDKYNICYSNAFPKIANYINKLLFISCKKNNKK